MSRPERNPRTFQKTAHLAPQDTPVPPKDFRRAVLNYAGAKKAVEKLTDAGLKGPNKDMFWRHLWGLVSLAKAEAEEDPSKRRSIRWYSLPGIPPHTMKRFPAKVRSWAADIEKMATAIQSNAVHGMTAGMLPLFLLSAIPNQQYEFSIGSEVFQEVGNGNPSVPADLARRVLNGQKTEVPKFADLPDLLRFYADYIDVLARLVASYGSAAPDMLNTGMRSSLVEFVQAVTGKPHWDQVATLLTAAYHANGCDAEVCPKALQMQYRRFKK